MNTMPDSVSEGPHENPNENWDTPEPRQVVRDCPDSIVNKHVLEAVTETMASKTFDGKTFAQVWFDREIAAGNSWLLNEVLNYLADIEEIQDGAFNGYHDMDAENHNLALQGEDL